jgi:hypothetical protein
VHISARQPRHQESGRKLAYVHRAPSFLRAAVPCCLSPCMREELGGCGAGERANAALRLQPQPLVADSYCGCCRLDESLCCLVQPVGGGEQLLVLLLAVLLLGQSMAGSTSTVWSGPKSGAPLLWQCDMPSNPLVHCSPGGSTNGWEMVVVLLLLRVADVYAQCCKMNVLQV